MRYFAGLCVALGVVVWAAEDVRIQGNVVRPEKAPPDVAQLKVPEGFQVRTFAQGLGNIRIMAVADNGHIYVTRREEADLLLLRDKDGDGQAEGHTVILKQPQLHGIAIKGNRVYLATIKEILVGDRKPDGTIGPLRTIVKDLPDGGQHPNRTLAISPDNKLYVSVGSTCNECRETSPESAAMVRMNLDGTKRTVFASGLRNTIGFAWHPETLALWGWDHGMDWLGDEEQHEELNGLLDSHNYGWPWVYDKGKVNPLEAAPEGFSKEAWAAESKNPDLLYTPHAAPMQMVFYTANELPAQYKNDAFVTMRGSWNRRPPSGYEVVRVRFAAGKPVETEPFLTGFLRQNGNSWTMTGRPVGLAIAKDGALLVGDDTNGVIYRVTYGNAVSSR